ncbi:glycoside hydrolase family 71/99-like protein [Winogradskyella marincola]|uniref:Glycoside hydrolase family 71/99-like protein n=1 Tax=Winogradskyella marincola TaxID=3037795 RepID=A0ABT6G059_9FLAO|nr:glycoside hydrolase family 71/99-like protein [Winogradskyella sp. YYF002]MDG4715432.1 glycoside hydrolase family 71/99-like protein [Winogradskyella sp. YYF002]
MKIFKRYTAGTLLLVFIMSSCSRDLDSFKEEATTIRNNVEVDSIIPDSILLSILEEETLFIEQAISQRIVDTTGMDVVKTNPKKVYAHYMPWFQSKDYDGYWGAHWTMANKNPEIIDANGKREIASYYYPEIGPYSSSDPDLQEYHFLMMKMSGIDGVIFDWYGSRDYYDYNIMKQATETFMWQLEDLGLDFSIMYEDRTAVQAVDLGFAVDTITAAQEDFEYVRDNYFTSPRYMQWEGKPLLFVFGPHHIQSPEDWDQIFTVFPEHNKPEYVTLWGANAWVGDNATGEFAWVDETHLTAHGHYYWHMTQPQNIDKLRVGSVYPSFNSFSLQGGWGLDHDWQIYPDGGDTFVETLNYTHHETSDFIQLVTWNDFGEGTMIEPTEEFGFLYLQLLQGYTGVSYTPQDLKTAQDLYFLRKSVAQNNQGTASRSANNTPNTQRFLDRVYYYIKRGQMNRARILLRAVERFYTTD